MKVILVNLITTVRLICSICLLLVLPYSTEFYILYTMAGLSDAFDGLTARKLNSTTKFGSSYDTICDFIFFMVTILIVFSCFTISLYIYILFGVVLLIKIFNICLGLIRLKKIYLPHSIFNKITGAIIFISVYFYSLCKIDYILIPVIIFAVISSINEMYLIIKRKSSNED